MAVDQLPGRMREFVAYLDGVLARLDQGAGWCAVFWQRDPDGMQACLDGREVPPWDVVESLLQDFAALYGPEVAHAEADRARPLHAAAQAAHDARPGGRDALGDRFDVMLREQRYAAERQAELGRRLAVATTQEEADAIRLDLAWARDDHERAVRRCAELRSRMAELDHRTLDNQAAAIRRGQVSDGGVFREAHRDGARRDRGWGDAGGAGQARGRDGREADPGSAEFPNIPQQRDAAPATDAEAPHTGRAPQRPSPTEAARSGHASGPAWADSSGAAPHRSGAAAEAARPAAASHSSAWADPSGEGSRRPGAAEAARSASAPQSSAWADASGDGSRRPGAAEAARSASASQPSAWADASGDGSRRPGAAEAARSASASQPSAWADASGDGSRRPGVAGTARQGYRPHPMAPVDAHTPDHAPQRPGPAEAAHPGHAPHQYRQADASGTAHAPYPQAPDRTPPPDTGPPQQPTPTAPPPEAKRKRRRGGARFAGVVEEDGAPVAVPPAAVPELPTAPVAKGRTPRGARFAGAAEVSAEGPRQGAEPVDAVARRETAETVAKLVRLRSEGRTGEAHGVLVELAHWPADRFPLLAAELQHAGLGADWATLLWEAASLPADRLVAAADALVAAGRGADGEQILRQGVARPAGEIGAAVLALVVEGRRREVAALLDAYVRVRVPEEAARSAEPDPGTLVPLLLGAARGVSEERHWDLVHALRVAGFSV
ncbi:hypothetical protein ACFXKY_21620 [Streptomyces canus]|uniref:hypothetical protein n=1 Tax=Streptomyces canus TaxID=58343 RepID=UPI0036931AEB